MGKEKRTNRHHLVAKSLKDEYNVHTPENIIRMDMNRHNALHALFGLLLTPKEQLLELSYLYESVLSHTAKQLFKELLELPDDKFYIRNVLKHGNSK